MAPLAAPDWSEGIEDAWSRVATFVPKLVGFLLILGIGYLVVKALSKAVDAVLERVGFDRAVERGGVAKALANSKYDASDIVSKLVFYTLLLFVLQMAFGVFGANPVSDMLNGVVAFLPKAFVAIVIVVVASAIAAAAKDIIGNTLGGLSYGKLLANAASVAILFFGVIAALQQIEVATLVTDRVLTAVLFALAGIAIVAVGGGGIQPMRAQWEKALNKVETEAPRVREQIDAQRAGFGQPYPEEPAAQGVAQSVTTGVTTGTAQMPTVEAPVRRLPTGGAQTQPRG
jgi:hypothetical protein